MSATILSRTIDSVLDKKLVLSTDQWAATLDIGDTWSQIRIGCRLSLQDTGADVTGGPRGYFGLMASPDSGMTNGPIGDLTSHFLGVSSVAALKRSISSPFFTRYAGIQLLGFRKRILAAESVFGSFGYSWHISAEPGTSRNALIVEITKGSPNFTVSAVRVSTAVCSSVDLSLADLTSAIQSATMADAATALNTVSTGGYSVVSASGAVDEATDGSLNAICCGWNFGSGLPEFSEIVFVRIA